MEKIKKVIAGVVCTLLVIATCPVRADAEWIKDNSGWWYSEGISWAVGWRQIEGKWYYFWPDSGYMAELTTIDGYFLDKSGAWIDDSNYNIPASKAEKIIEDRFAYAGAYVKCSGLEENKWIVRIFEDNEYKTTNVGWYYVDINSGVVSTMF